MCIVYSNVCSLITKEKSQLVQQTSLSLHQGRLCLCVRVESAFWKKMTFVLQIISSRSFLFETKKLLDVSAL